MPTLIPQRKACKRAGCNDLTPRLAGKSAKIAPRVLSRTPRTSIRINDSLTLTPAGRATNPVGVFYCAHEKPRQRSRALAGECKKWLVAKWCLNIALFLRQGRKYVG